MEHFYVITGNEYGANLRGKKNFPADKIEEATAHYESVTEDDFYAGLIYVNEEGKETVIFEKIDE